MNEQNLTYSEIFYLFADQLVPTAGFLGLKDEHPAGKKLKAQSLGDQMVRAAFVYLLNNGYIRVSRRTDKKLLIFSEERIYVSKLKEKGPEVTGIEGKLLDEIGPDTRLLLAVVNLLDSDKFDPWGEIASLTKNSLVGKSLLKSEAIKKLIFVSFKYYFPDSGNMVASFTKDKMLEAISTFEKSSDANLITKTISDAIKLREEKQDSGD